MHQQRTLVEQLSLDLGICSAPDVEQQTAVVGLHRGLRVDTQPRAQAHGDHGAVQTVLQR
jgi:hypothetical protein